jgi:hypothetical protein
MDLSSQEYIKSLNQLNQTINGLEEQLTILKLQYKVSQLFLDLNNSADKKTYVSSGYFFDILAYSPAFFNVEQHIIENMIIIHFGDNYITYPVKGYTYYFIDGELETLYKNGTWSVDSFKHKRVCVQLMHYIVRPVWIFLDRETKDRYVKDLSDLEERINNLRRNLNQLKLGQRISQLFYELNISTIKEIRIPVGMFLSVISSCNTYFTVEPSIKTPIEGICVGGTDYYIHSSKCMCYFVNGEAEFLYRNVQWSEEYYGIKEYNSKIKTYTVRPTWLMTDLAAQIPSEQCGITLLLNNSICCPYEVFSPCCYFPSKQYPSTQINKLSSNFVNEPYRPNKLLHKLLSPLCKLSWSQPLVSKYLNIECKSYTAIDNFATITMILVNPPEECNDEHITIKEDDPFYEHSADILDGENLYGQCVFIFNNKILIGLFSSIRHDFFFSYKDINWCPDDVCPFKWNFDNPLLAIDSIIDTHY